MVLVTPRVSRCALLSIVITWAFGLATANAQTFDLSDATALAPVTVMSAIDRKPLGEVLATGALNFPRSGVGLHGARLNSMEARTMGCPTLQQFIETVTEAFAFLQQFGFREVSPPPHRAGESFQVWFRADQRVIIIKGEGYGTMASVTLEHDDGLELSEIDLVPLEDRPRQKGKSRNMQSGQLQQVREAARRLEAHGADFLAGDLTRFRARARPLPLYKRSSM